MRGVQPRFLMNLRNSTQDLEHAYKSTWDEEAKTRLYAIREIVKGNSAKSVAYEIGCSHAVVLNWLKKYEKGGVAEVIEKENRRLKRQIPYETMEEICHRRLFYPS